MDDLWDEFEGMVRLDLAAPKFPPAPAVVEAIRDAAGGVNRYPEANWSRLVEEVARYEGVEPDMVLLTNGGDEAIELVTAAFEGTVGVAVPTFSQFKEAAVRRKREVREFKLGGDFSPPRDMEADLMWVCNPNNPTGNTCPEEGVRELMERGQVVIDEVYYGICEETMGGLVEEGAVIIRSFSKSFSLAGLRMGYIIAQPEKIRRIARFRQPFSVNRLAQVAAVASLENLPYYRRAWQKLREERKWLAGQLGQFFDQVYPSKANFVLVKSGQAREIYDGLVECGVKVFGGWSSEFTGLDGDFLRISIGNAQENRKLVYLLKNMGGEENA